MMNVSDVLKWIQRCLGNPRICTQTLVAILEKHGYDRLTAIAYLDESGLQELDVFNPNQTKTLLEVAHSTRQELWDANSFSEYCDIVERKHRRGAEEYRGFEE